MPSNSPDAAYKGVFVRRTLNPSTRTNGTSSGVAVDTAERGGCDSVVAFVITSGMTDGSHACAIEESADGSTGWTAVPAGRIYGTQPTLTSADATTQKEWGAAVSLRYVRITATVTGATSGGVYGGGFVLTGSHYEAH